MKRFLLLNLTLLFCATALSAQTYRYDSVSKIDENEVRHKLDGGRYYITFTNNKQVMYLSDEHGNAKYNGNFTFKLTGEQNGILTYSFVYPEDPRKSGNNSPYAAGTYVGTMQAIKNSKRDETTFSFSSDYKRLNERSYDVKSNKFYIFVFEKQEETKAPSVMY